MNINVMMPRRSADIHVINDWCAHELNTEVGSTVPCHVLAIYPCSDDGYSGIGCLCELLDGSMVELDPKYVVFTDIDKEGEII